MMLRLFYLIRCWVLLFILGLSSGGCIKNQNDFFFLRDLLLIDAEAISSYITGKKNKVDDKGNIIGEETSEKNFRKAHTLFLSLKERLQEYQKITRYPIAKSTLEKLESILKELKEDIEGLSDSGEKSQFSKEYKQLTEYVDSLINQGLSEQPTIYGNRAG